MGGGLWQLLCWGGGNDAIQDLLPSNIILLWQTETVQVCLLGTPPPKKKNPGAILGTGAWTKSGMRTRAPPKTPSQQPTPLSFLPCPDQQPLRSSLPLQMLLYFHAFYLPFWCLAEGVMLELKVCRGRGSQGSVLLEAGSSCAGGTGHTRLLRVALQLQPRVQFPGGDPDSPLPPGPRLKRHVELGFDLLGPDSAEAPLPPSHLPCSTALRIRAQGQVSGQTPLTFAPAPT